MKTPNFPIVKKIVVGTLCASMLLTSALTLAGCNNEESIAELQQSISTLSTKEQITALEAKLATLTDADDVAEVKALIEQLATAEKLAELEAKLATLTTAEETAEIKAMIEQLPAEEKIAVIDAKLDTLSTKDDVAELKALLALLATTEDLTALIQKIDDLATADQLGALIEMLTPPEQGPLAADYADEAYEKFLYIDKVLKDRDCLAGDKFQMTQKWIIFNLIDAGYVEGVDIVKQDTTMTKYVKIQDDAKAYKDMYPAVDQLDVSEETYVRSGRNYVVAEDGNGTHVKVTLHTPNIIVTKPGKSEKTIIVGAHYDGDGSGDNGSSVALALTTAQHLYGVETEYTIQFVFFTAEEYGLYGSSAYVAAMTEEEIANTLYMINMDSLVCGDFCYLYGGVQDDDNQTVTDTGAYDNAMAVATAAGLSFKSNPWTWDNPAPGYDSPDYASPSTGDWSDHAPFKNAGIPYLYFEATNWEIPGPYYEYDGYGETYLVGMLMNTPNDYVEYIETYFPGRPYHHLKQFSTLLNLLLTQDDYNG